MSLDFRLRLSVASQMDGEVSISCARYENNVSNRNEIIKVETYGCGQLNWKNSQKLQLVGGGEKECIAVNCVCVAQSTLNGEHKWSDFSIIQRQESEQNFENF